MSAEQIYTTVSQASVLIPILFGGIYYRHLSKSFRVFFIFLLVTILFEIQANIAVVLYHNNMPGLHVYTAVEMFTFSYLYYANLRKKNSFAYIILINAVIFVIIAFADALLINGINAPNSISRTYSSISLTIYALIYFSSLFRLDTALYSWQYPLFWLSVSVLLYFGLNTFYFMLANYLFSNTIIMAVISSNTHEAINIIANCLIAQAFRCYRNLQAE